MENPNQYSVFFSLFSPEEMVDIKKKLDPNKSIGPFSIPNKILHLRINEISTIFSAFLIFL